MLIYFIEKHAGSISLLYIQSPKYSTEVEKKLNQAAWKRGTGGRSSFNGVVATVFGASGFVGRYVCNKLGKIGTQVLIQISFWSIVSCSLSPTPRDLTVCHKTYLMVKTGARKPRLPHKLAKSCDVFLKSRSSTIFC